MNKLETNQNLYQENPTLSTITNLSKALGVSIDELLK